MVNEKITKEAIKNETDQGKNTINDRTNKILIIIGGIILFLSILAFLASIFNLLDNFLDWIAVIFAQIGVFISNFFKSISNLFS